MLQVFFYIEEKKGRLNMTDYKIPFYLSYEDKIIGGNLSIRQAI